MSDRVTLEVGDDHVAVVTLNRPDKLNALDQGIFEGLHEVAARVRDEAAAGRCRAVLLRGAGRAFSSGLDVSLFGQQLGALSEGRPVEDDWIAWLQQAFTAYEDLPVPTVAAIQGVALGGGCQLALAGHLRIATPDASFGLLEARWGLIPDLGGTYRLPRLVGQSRAIDLCVSGRRIDGETAHAWGLVDALLDPETFEDEARRYVARLAAGPTVALGAVPRLVREGLVATREDALAAERRAQVACLASDDFQEAVQAALGGRAAGFRGA